MQHIRVSVILIFILTLLTPLAVAQDSESELALTISRTACFGTCPVYTVSVYQDGTVVYEGENHVDVTGTQTTNVEPELVQELVNNFVELGYFEWNDEYTAMTVSDLPTVTTSVTYNGETKTIERYAGDSTAPLALLYLENWLDLAVNTSQWTGAELQVASYTPTQTPVITLQRQQCFGFCPEYNLVVYDDGTVVYTGISNVNVTGVHMSTVDTASVTLLATLAESMGYFDWQDEYTEYFMTDQATVISSVTWEDQYKRIERYDGDPNAPIGLVRLEDQIDNVVNITQWLR